MSPIIVECWVIVDDTAVVRPGANLVELFYMFGTVQTSVCVADFAPLRLIHLVANQTWLDNWLRALCVSGGFQKQRNPGSILEKLAFLYYLLRECKVILSSN